MVLTIYDISGIQNFIFSTNKLKEIIGASKIISMALFSNIPKMLGEDEEQWKIDSFSFCDENKKKIVYIGGGNALMVFDCESTEKAFTKELAEKVFLQSGGALRLCSASIQLSESETLAANQQVLMEKLDSYKKNAGRLLPSVCAPFVAYDNNNYEALIYHKGGGQITRSRKAKITASPVQNRAFNDLLWGDKKFTNQFEQFVRDNEKNYIAIIHIDGNTMGIKIREFVESLTSAVIPAFDDMKKLSIRISELYKNVLKETIADIFSDFEDKILPFRPIIADGDDITVIIDSLYAFNFVEVFFEKLKKNRIFDSGFVPTAAAGIVFSKIKFPFSDAYALAEACCKNAKSKTLERNGVAENSVDFQIIYSSINENLQTTRKEYYEIAENESLVNLIKRPYIFGLENEYSYENFKNTVQLMNRYIKNKAIARSKLKGLRNAFAGGKSEAEDYLAYIISHTKSKKEAEAARAIENMFSENNETVLFDYLDVMDIVSEGE